MQRIKYKHARTKTLARLIPLLCGLVFVVFSVCYLHLLQPGLIAWEQHVISGGRTAYNPLVGTVLITLALTVLGILLNMLLNLPIRVRALAWMPPCYLLGLLTCMHFPDLSSDPGQVRIGLLFILPLLFAIALWISYGYPDLRDEYASPSDYIAPNMALMAFFFLTTGLIGNTTPILHYELKAHNLVRQHRYEEALRVGNAHASTSHDLSMLRTFALGQTGQLPERLFAYPMSGSQDLLPQLSDTLDTYDGRLAFKALGYLPNTDGPYPVARFLSMAQARDTLGSPLIGQYLLSAHLLDRNLDAFARDLSRNFVPSDSLAPMPRLYEEALLLHAYEKKDTLLASQTTSETIRARFDDFLSRMNHTSDGRSPLELCRSLFPDSYWTYYFFPQGE